MENIFSITLWEILLFFVSGLIVLLNLATRPRFFWPILIFLNVGTSGLMIKGYCFIEEYFTICILLGIFLAISKGTIKLKKIEKISFFRLVFYLMIFYFLAQTLRGLLILRDWKILRWVEYYASIAILLCVISRIDFPQIESQKTSKIVSVSGFIYLVGYLIHGCYFEFKLGRFGRWAMQGISWSGSSYALFPLIAILPAIIILLKNSSRKVRFFGWSLVGLIAILANFYESRASWILMIILFIAALPFLGMKKIVPLLIILLSVFTFFFFSNNIGNILEKVNIRIKALSESAQFLITKERDIDRDLQLKIGFEAVNQNIGTLLFGYGVHSNHTVLVPIKKRFYSQYLPDTKVGDIVRTTTFTALLVDTGLIGILFLTANFLLLIFNIMTQRGLFKFILITDAILIFFWFFITNIQDIMLLYLMIMPGGLITKFFPDIGLNA